MEEEACKKKLKDAYKDVYNVKKEVDALNPETVPLVDEAIYPAIPLTSKTLHSEAWGGIALQNGGEDENEDNTEIV